MATAATPPLTLVDALRREIRSRHMSLRTEDTYVYWARDFMRFHGRRHPRETGPSQVGACLSILANRRRRAACTHNQAPSALLFRDRAVLKVELPWLQNLQRPGRPPCLSVVLTVAEVTAVLARLAGEHGLLARMSYGAGMRTNEALCLRVKDVDFDRFTLIAQGKGDKDRALMLPQALVAHLRAQLAYSRSLGCPIAQTTWPVSN